MKRLFLLAAGLFVAASCFWCTSQDVLAAAPGDCLINEFVANPSGADTDKEWIEIFNASGAAVNLSGWIINDGSNHAISGSSTIPAGGYAVVCRNADASLNGGVTCHYTAALALANSGDRNIVLRDNLGNEINSISYADGSIVEGASRYRDAGTWQNSTSGFYNGSDYGTPGSVNVAEEEVVDAEKSGSLNANVSLTLLDINALVQQDSANISFHVNANGTGTVQYGMTNAYGQNETESIVAGANEIELADLECNTTYHYRVSVSAGGETVASNDATFEIVCGAIDINSLNMTKAAAKADGTFENGWEWVYDITVWDEEDDNLQMKFGQWGSGANAMNSAGNVRFSVDNGATWTEIVGNDVYSSLVAVSDANVGSSGIQARIVVQTKVPKGTLMGSYGAGYSIRAE